MKFSIAHFTNRADPKFDWFVDSLCAQLPDDVEVDLMFIDLRLDYDKERKDYLKKIVNDRLAYRHLPPKPNPWQGKYRKTLADFFCASNARNTAFLHAQSDYIMCVDDVSILMPGYVKRVLRAVKHGYTVLGAYKKATKMEVKNGELLSFGNESVDSRWAWAEQQAKATQLHAETWRKEKVKYPDDAGIDKIYKDAMKQVILDSNFVKAPSSILYGCSFGLPLDLALEVNGFDESYDGMGFEDPDFGTRVFRLNDEMYYDRGLLTIESEEGHNQPESNVMRRLKLAENGEVLDWYMLNRLNADTERTLPLANWTNLKNMREKKTFELITHPMTDWVDNQPYEEMTTIERAGDQLIAEKILRSGEKDSAQWEHHKNL